MTQLEHKLRTVDYFTIGFGTMVGVGWLVVMDDWLQRGGPMGGILGFAIGGVALLPIAYVYGQLVMAMPDAASEIAYTAKVFPHSVSFGTGWLMMLAYFIVCPWEAVAVSRIASFIFPGLNTFELYRIAGQPVYLPHLFLGLALTAVITTVNYRGIQLSAAFQNWTTFGLLLLFILFSSCGFTRGSIANLKPSFSHGALLSVFLVVQIVPYFMNGFESVAKCSEEAHPAFHRQGFFRAIVAAVLVAIGFYTIVIATVSCVYPWQSLAKQRFATAYAFEQAFRSRWIVDVILAAALLSLVKVFNGNFLAASRLFFALGRRGMIEPRIGAIHPHFHTPWLAVLGVGLMTAVLVFVGSALLVPVTEVGSMTAAVGWLATCSSYFFMQRRTSQRTVTMIGAIVALALVLMKVLPYVPGSFTAHEWGTLAVWVLLGVVLRSRAKAVAAALND
jgi:basic amino acid/polyamine antiporter, APA family